MRGCALCAAAGCAASGAAMAATAAAKATQRARRARRYRFVGMRSSNELLGSHSYIAILVCTSQHRAVAFLTFSCRIFICVPKLPRFDDEKMLLQPMFRLVVANRQRPHLRERRAPRSDVGRIGRPLHSADIIRRSGRGVGLRPQAQGVLTRPAICAGP